MEIEQIEDLLLQIELLRADGDIIICDACGLPIVGDAYNDRHTEHEADCPNYGLYDEDDPDDPIDCFCDLEYHAACCPRCNGG